MTDGRMPPNGARAWSLAALTGFALGFAGCSLPVSIPIVPSTGGLYTHFRAPLVLPGVAELGDVKIPEGAPELYIRIPTPYIPTDFAFGRIDVENAARKAGIDRLVYADYEYRSFLSYFRAMTIHAHGFAAPEAEGARTGGE